MATTAPLQESLPNIHTDAGSAIAEFEQILLSNSGEDAFESAIKLLAAKLIDEIRCDAGSSAKFTQHSTPQGTHAAITNLYRQAVEKWPELGDGNDLEISPSHLVRSIRPLLGWRLRGSDLAWLDASLERLVARDSKGNLGQYFTPRDVVQMCVDILNPTSKDLVLDPACGSGGFLFEAVRHSIDKTKRPPRCLGIDFSTRSVKVATLLAAALDDTTISVSKANSLDGRAYAADTPSEWSDFLIQDAASSTRRARSWGAWNRLGCDVLLTNPPFAGDIDDADLLDAYESQHDSQQKKSISREHLFLERAVNLLRPGGRLAIVLPQGLLANSTAGYLRSWLFRSVRMIGVVGLHPYAFLPYTAVKTAILFLEKPAAETGPAVDYPVLFAVSRSAGKDSSGRQCGRPDYKAIADAFKLFLCERRVDWADDAVSVAKSPLATEKVMLSEIIKSGRLDAEHYDPFARSISRNLASRTNANVSSVVESRIPRFRKASYREISYLDISSIDGRTGIPFPQIIAADDAPSRASYIVSKGDVLVSTVRPDRNLVALVTSESDVPSIASNGFCVLRAKDVPPELLFAYCKTAAFRDMLAMHATASMYPTVSDRDVLSIPFVMPPSEISDEVVNSIRSSMAMIEKAQQEIRNAIGRMESFVSEVSGQEPGGAEST